MYTAIVQKTEETQDGLKVYVDFHKDGIFDHTEEVTPQDRPGFLYWKESRLKSLNSKITLAPELTTNLNITDLGVVVLTQEQKAKNAWFAKYYELEQLEKIQAKGFLTGPRLTALTNKMNVVKAFLDANVKVEYLDFI